MDDSQPLGNLSRGGKRGEILALEKTSKVNRKGRLYPTKLAPQNPTQLKATALSSLLSPLRTPKAKWV